MFGQLFCLVARDSDLVLAPLSPCSPGPYSPPEGEQNSTAVIAVLCLSEGQSHNSIFALGSFKVCLLKLFVALGAGGMAQQEENLEKKQGHLPIKTRIVL